MKIFLILLGLPIAMIANAQVNDMVQVGDIYVDKYEAPNIAGVFPFVMFSYNEAECWCQAQGKRLLFDDEWELAAGGPDSFPPVHINETFTISPNPATNYITINTEERAAVHILNIEGSIIKTINISDPQTRIDVRNLSSGVYILKVMTDKGILKRKVIKE